MAGSSCSGQCQPDPLLRKQGAAQGKEEPRAHSHTEQWGLFLQHTRKATHTVSAAKRSLFCSQVPNFFCWMGSGSWVLISMMGRSTITRQFSSNRSA